MNGLDAPPMLRQPLQQRTIVWLEFRIGKRDGQTRRRSIVAQNKVSDALLLQHSLQRTRMIAKTVFRNGRLCGRQTRAHGVVRIKGWGVVHKVIAAAVPLVKQPVCLLIVWQEQIIGCWGGQLRRKNIAALSRVWAALHQQHPILFRSLLIA